MKVVLEVKSLTKVFSGRKNFTAVDRVSFMLQEGEIVGLLGPNGAGKSTTIHMLLGTLTPSSGSIKYFDRDFYMHRSDVLGQVGYVNGYSRLPGILTVQENLEIYARIAGLAWKERKIRIEKLLKRFDGTTLRKRLVGKLSAGQATRIMLAKAFLGHPKMVLLDEPTAALDPDVCADVRAFVQEQRREYGVSMLYTSHNMSEVAEVCDRVIFLKDGRIVAVDKPERLAATIAVSTLRVHVENEARAACKALEELSDNVSQNGSWIEASIASEEIANALRYLTVQGVHFSDIEVLKPTLEDYFLRMAS